LQCREEEGEPRRPVRHLGADRALGAAQRQVVALLALLDDALQRAVGAKTGSITSAQPATSCSSREPKDLISGFESRRSTSRSNSRLPSMRVEQPMLSTVATRRRAERRSGARVPKARQAPLSSSISATRESISGVIRKVDAWMITHSYTRKYPLCSPRPTSSSTPTRTQFDGWCCKHSRPAAIRPLRDVVIDAEHLGGVGIAGVSTAPPARKS
jgi:hypothetical protein